MALTAKQQKKFWRPMVARAWRAHCERESITDSTQASKDEWYRAELLKCFGVASSKLVDPRQGFEKGMAHFEVIANDGSFYWQEREIAGDAIRARHNLDETVTMLRLTEEYVAAICRQMGLHRPLRQCSAGELVKLRVALLYHCRRAQDRVVERSYRREPLP